MTINKMDNDDNFAVSMTRCFYCLEDNMIVLNTLLTMKNANTVRSMSGKVIDMTPCSKCDDLMKQGVILITFDPKQSDPEWYKSNFPNPYRTGGFFVVKDDAMRRIITDKRVLDFALKQRWVFIEHEVGEKLGLFDLAALEKKDNNDAND